MQASYPIVLSGRTLELPYPRSNMHDWHTSGTSETPVLYPIPCSSRHVITPSDAARPYAEPPDSTMALIGLSAVIGIVRGVSLDAGPPPLMSQPVVAPSGKYITVTPVPASLLEA